MNQGDGCMEKWRIVVSFLATDFFGGGSLGVLARVAFGWTCLC
jgi:hypothetical protein